MRTDFDFGLAAEALNILRGNQDTLLAKMSQVEVSMCGVALLLGIRNHLAMLANGTH